MDPDGRLLTACSRKADSRTLFRFHSWKQKSDLFICHLTVFTYFPLTRAPKSCTPGVIKARSPDTDLTRTVLRDVKGQGVDRTLLLTNAGRRDRSDAIAIPCGYCEYQLCVSADARASSSFPLPC